MPDLGRIKEFKDRVADTATSVADSAQDTLHDASEKVTDTASSVTGALQDASQKASVKATDAAASAVWSAQDALQEASEAITDTASSIADSVQEVASEAANATAAAAENVTGGAKGALESTTDAVQGTTQKVSEKVTDTASSIADSVQEVASEAANATAAAAENVTGGAKGALEPLRNSCGCRDPEVQEAANDAADASTAAVQGVKSSSKSALESTTGTVQDIANTVPDVATAAAERVKSGSKHSLEVTTSAANALLSTTQGLLASGLSGVVNDLVQGMVKGVPTVYDKAMDARFIETGIGGSYHRLFDGGHTIIGAFNAVRGASPDDNIVQEALGTVQGLLRDVSTPRGLPLATWDKETFDQVAATLDSSFHIPKSWFYDLNTFDAAELLGGSVGAVVLIFNWNRADTETFARFVGSMGVSSALSANPLLLIVTVVALARAFQKAHRTGEYAEFVDGQLKGGIVSGATLAAVSLVGGPAGMALLVALVTGILVNKATQNVSIVQIGQVVARQATAAATEAKGMIAQQVPVLLG